MLKNVNDKLKRYCVRGFCLFFSIIINLFFFLVYWYIEIKEVLVNLDLVFYCYLLELNMIYYCLKFGCINNMKIKILFYFNLIKDMYKNRGIFILI